MLGEGLALSSGFPFLWQHPAPGLCEVFGGVRGNKPEQRNSNRAAEGATDQGEPRGPSGQPAEPFSKLFAEF